MAPRIEVTSLWEGYRAGGKRRRLPWRGSFNWALRDVSISVSRGEMLGVIGRNGSGKTTLLQAVSGVIPPTKGHIATEGRVASLVDLSAGFHRDLTGRENLLIGGVLLGLSRREIRDRFDEVVEFAGLEADALEAPLSTYSSGMGLRLGFALVLSTRPDVLLVDEVLAVGDEGFQASCLNQIDALLARGGSVLLVSHDLDLVSTRCHRAVVLQAGEVRDTGSAAEAVDRYHEMLAHDARS